MSLCASWRRNVCSAEGGGRREGKGERTGRGTGMGHAGLCGGGSGLRPWGQGQEKEMKMGGNKTKRIFFVLFCGFSYLKTIEMESLFSSVVSVDN